MNGVGAALTFSIRQPKRNPHYAQLQQVLNDLQNDPSAWPFVKPVDASVVTDYYNVITNPMGKSIAGNSQHIWLLVPPFQSISRHPLPLASALGNKWSRHTVPDLLSLPVIVYMVLTSILSFMKRRSTPESSADLSTMEFKLESNHYATVDDFVSDARLIFANCRQYNGEKNQYANLANKLERALDRILKKRGLAA